jgi:hypothetical protein
MATVEELWAFFQMMHPGVTWGPVGEVIKNVIISGRDLFVSLWGIGTDLIKIINILPLPPSWSAILGLIVGSVVALRVYSYVKDVEIFGFKI